MDLLRATEILDRIRRERLDVSEAKPLPFCHYDESHELFEGSSNQQAKILSWLMDFQATSGSSTEPLTVLSVGCGSGILDLPLIESMADSTERLVYVGVDPNPIACDRFRQAFAELDLGSVELKLHETSIDNLECSQSYDLIHAVHSLYYFNDPSSDIDRIAARLQAAGKMVLFHAPKGPLNQLANCFWTTPSVQPHWFSEELERHLKSMKYSYRKDVLDASLDVTGCFESENAEGEMILDFILQTACRDLGEQAIRLCLEFLDVISAHKDQKVLAPHPVDVFIVEATY